MEIKINFEKKHLYFLVGFLVVIGAILLVKAIVPNPGHPVTEVDLSQDFSIGGSVTFNKLVNSWNVMGWSLAGLCFSDAKSTLGASFPGYASVAGNFDRDSNPIWTTGQHTGNEVCNSLGSSYNRCIGYYEVNLFDGIEVVDLPIAGDGCNDQRSYNHFIGPQWDWGTTYAVAVCCSKV